MSTSTIAGLEARLFHVREGNGEVTPVIPEADGYIGRPQTHDRIRIVVDSPQSVLGIQVQGARRHIVVLHDHTEGTPERRRVKFQVAITDATLIALQRKLPAPVPTAVHQLCPFPAMNTANICMLELADNGVLTMWKVGVMSQFGNMFFLVRRHYQSQCYAMSDDSIVCPQLPKWSELPSVLAQMRMGRTVELPSLETAEAPAPRSRNGITESVGVVDWFDSFYAGGGGVVLTAQGPAWVHWSQIEPTKVLGLRTLEAGDHVTWESIEPQEGEKANRLLPWKLTGVCRSH